MEIRYKTMHVYVTSFSYKRGFPPDPKGDGGGFVFDCRLLPNPFWDVSLRKFTGRDKPVADFMDGHRGEVDAFVNPVKQLVSLAVKTYSADGRSRLSVAFGCTGGQHRSVYCAEVLADFLRKKEGVDVELVHSARDLWDTEN